MGSPCNYRRPVESQGYGFQVNPLSAGLERSPCLCHPRTGKPCKLRYADKNNPSCENCGPLGKGDCWNPAEYIPVVYKISDKRYHDCGYPGCTKQTRGDYCRPHLNMIAARKVAWDRDNPGVEIDIDWLHRPIEHGKANRGQGRKLKK